MDTETTGGYAFPTTSHDKGMTLRDYLASSAMSGLLAGAEVTVEPSEIARQAYLVADAMIKHRK